MSTINNFIALNSNTKIQISTFLSKFLIDNLYLLLVLTHLLLGIVIYLLPFLSTFFALSIFFFGLFFVIKNKNKNNEVLFVSGYLLGLEVLLRITKGSPNYEFAKFSVVIFMILGMCFSGISKKSLPFFIFLLLLIPSVLIVSTDLEYLKTKVIFDISGSICLGISSIYTYKKEITEKQLNTILLTIALPLVSMGSYLFFKSPSIHMNVKTTESNFIFTGNFGPNQVATVLGIGMFVFFIRLFSKKNSNKIIILNIILSSYLFYRGLISFSRGGIITGIILIIIVSLFHFVYKTKYKIKRDICIMKLFLTSYLLVILLVIYQTDGLLVTRYENKNVNGSENYNSINGRRALLKRDIKIFVEKPVLGIGVGKGRESSIAELGSKISSHNEITRLLSEHGLFGVAAIIILFLYPFLFFLEDKQNIYLISFFVFWLLTINHSALRIAAPSFIYALTLLKIKKE